MSSRTYSDIRAEDQELFHEWLTNQDIVAHMDEDVVQYDMEYIRFWRPNNLDDDMAILQELVDTNSVLYQVSVVKVPNFSTLTRRKHNKLVENHPMGFLNAQLYFSAEIKRNMSHLQVREIEGERYFLESMSQFVSNNLSRNNIESEIIFKFFDYYPEYFRCNERMSACTRFLSISHRYPEIK